MTPTSKPHPHNHSSNTLTDQPPNHSTLTSHNHKRKQLHLCGSPAFLPLVQRLAHHTGDTVEVRRYERLSPLTTAKRPVKDWGADIKPGDCVVAFSRRKLFQLKNEIEVATAQRPTAQRLRCCVVYGALPPEARREQARLFNGVWACYVGQLLMLLFVWLVD